MTALRTRVLLDEDAAALDSFLRGYPPGLTLRSDVRRAGRLADGPGDHRALHLGAFEGDALVAALAHSDHGITFAAPRHLGPLLDALARHATRAVRGLSGPSDQVAAARAHLSLSQAAVFSAVHHLLLGLEVDALRPPASREGQPAATCELARPEEAELMTRWRHDLYVEDLGLPPGGKVMEFSRQQIEDEIRASSLFVLRQEGVPVASAAFGAAYPDAVQIGSVFTPPEHRGRGHGKAVTAGAVEHARRRGVRLALLTTAVSNEIAQKTYRALGFEKLGEQTLLLFTQLHSLP